MEAAEPGLGELTKGVPQNLDIVIIILFHYNVQQ